MAEPPEHLAQRLRWGGRKFDFTVDRLRLPNGAVGEFECLRHPGGALAVPLLADGRLVLVRQYRFPVAERLLEFPAGTLEPGEAPEATIRRELEEETGYRAHRVTPLAQFPLAPGYSDETIHAFVARQLEALDQPPPQDADEDIAVECLTPGELAAAMAEGTVDAKTMAAYALLADAG